MGHLLTLVHQLKLALPALPGFRSLALFGSVAEGRADGYSDLDMKVGTENVALAKLHLLGLLEKSIGPVEFCWATEPGPDEWVPTIVFREYGYYHRLDIALLGPEAADLIIADARTAPLLEADPPGATASVPPSDAYAPLPGSVGHFLLSQLIGGARYLKARKRGQAMMCYRFAVAAADWCARALHDRVVGTPLLGRKLNTPEYAALDRLATSEQRLALLDSLDFTTPAAMDRAMCAILTLLSEHANALALTVGETIPQAVADRFLGFVRDELQDTSACSPYA